jgi:hypothetical protein
MLKLSHSALVLISGLVWLAVGCFLLPLGLSLLVTSTYSREFVDSLPMLNSLAPYVGGLQQAALFIIVIFLFIGNMKGRYVLGKSVQRSVNRITSFPNPTSLTNIYSRGYYILFASMIGLGMSIKFFGLSNDIRGAIDIAVGAALISGALLYFRNAIELRNLEKAKAKSE